MLWFTNKKKRRMEMAQQGIRATSKTSLKIQCLFCAKGDLKEAKELYDFLASDMVDLPDSDPIPPTWVDNTKDMVNGVIGWVKENQDTLAQGYDFLNSIIEKRKGVNATPTQMPPQEPLPAIN